MPMPQWLRQPRVVRYFQRTHVFHGVWQARLASTAQRFQPMNIFAADLASVALVLVKAVKCAGYIVPS